MTARPFDDIRALIAGLPAMPAPEPAAALGGLGLLNDLAAWLSAASGRASPAVNRPVIALYAASHGIAPAAKAVRARLEEVASGAAPVARIAGVHGAGLEAFDLAVDRPDGDIRAKAAMSEKECAATIAFGMEALAKQPDLLIVGSISGPAGDHMAAALAAALSGETDDETSDPVARAASESDLSDPLEALRQLGGRETAALMGAIAAARTQNTPVVLDGFPAFAAAAVLHALNPAAVAHCRAADASVDPRAGRLLARLGLSPVAPLATEQAEGAAGAATIGILRAAAALR